MRKLIPFFLAAIAYAQPQCSQNLFAFGTGRQASINNKASGCNSWTFQYWTANVATISIEVDSANDNGSGSAGAFSTITPVSFGANPSTTLTGLVQFTAYAPFLSVNITTFTTSGLPASVTWSLYGVNPVASSRGGGGSGSGANVFLSNLQSPTALNQTLTFNTGLGNAINLTNNTLLNGNGIVLSGNGTIQVGANFATNSNCSNTASPAVCGSSLAGSSVIAAAATTEQINTTLVTSGSQILLTADSSLGTRLGVTCNITIPTLSVSARSAGASFTVTASAAPVTNPLCFDWLIIN